MPARGHPPSRPRRRSSGTLAPPIEAGGRSRTRPEAGGREGGRVGGTSASSKYGKTEEDSLEHSAMDEGRTSREVSSQASGTREATARSVRTRVNPESRRGGGAGLGGVVTAALPASTASSRRTALTPGSQEDGPVLFSPARGGAASRRHIDGRRARCAGRRAYGGGRASQKHHDESLFTYAQPRARRSSRKRTTPGPERRSSHKRTNPGPTLFT